MSDPAEHAEPLPEPQADAGPPFEQLVNILRERFLKTHLHEHKPLPEGMKQALPAGRLKEIEDAAAVLRGKSTVAPDRTVETQAVAWLKTQQARVGARQMTSGRCGNKRSCLDHFKTFLGAGSDIGSIGAQQLEGFYQHCLNRIEKGLNGDDAGWSARRGKDVFAVARSFVRWLVEQGTIEPPRNLTSNSFGFGSDVKKVETWTPAEFQTVVEEASGKLKLALLLMANCGATQKDVSDLKDSEVDWRHGRIIRKRSKTGKHKNVPEVNYKLWPTTFELLKTYRSGNPDHVLLNAAGKEFVRSGLKDERKVRKADGFASLYVELKKRLQQRLPGFNGSLKGLRKLGASLLAGHKDYRSLYSYFLGHAPETMADRHYVAIEPQALFDEAVLWLGQQLGQVKSRPATVSLASPGSAKVSPTMRSATGSTAGALPSGLGSGTTASGETWGSSSR